VTKETESTPITAATKESEHQQQWVNINNSGDKRISTYDSHDEGDRVNIDRQWQVNTDDSDDERDGVNTYDGGDEEDRVYRDRVNKQ